MSMSDDSRWIFSYRLRLNESRLIAQHEALYIVSVAATFSQIAVISRRNGCIHVCPLYDTSRALATWSLQNDSEKWFLRKSMIACNFAITDRLEPCTYSAKRVRNMVAKCARRKKPNSGRKKSQIWWKKANFKNNAKFGVLQVRYFLAWT